jgi:hypothetical protein
MKSQTGLRSGIIDRSRDHQTFPNQFFSMGRNVMGRIFYRTPTPERPPTRRFPSIDPSPTRRPQKEDRQRSHQQACPNIRSPMSTQMESSPSHSHCKCQAQPSSPRSPNKGHETQPRGNGSMPGWKRSVGMASDDPTAILSWTEPTLLHRHLRSSPADERPQSRPHDP